MSSKTAETKQSKAQETEYQGRPLLALYQNAKDPYAFKFGLAKAGLILAHLEEIKAFHAKHQKKEVTPTA